MWCRQKELWELVECQNSESESNLESRNWYALSGWSIIKPHRDDTGFL